MDSRPASPRGRDPSPLAAHTVLAVYSYRFLTAAQVSQLFPHHTHLVDVTLQRLVDGMYLAGIRRPVLDADQPDTVYALARRGADLVAARLGVDRASVRWRKYHNLVGLPFVEHRLAVNDVRIAMTVGLAALGFSLELWRYEVPIKEDVDDPDEGAPPLAFRPDAYIRYLVGERRLHFFLEVDMATESHKRFAGKVRRYLAYKESRLFRVRVGGRSFRVLTVVPTLSRLTALKRVTESQGGQRMFWFARRTDVTAKRIAEPVWQLAGEDDVGAGLFDSGESVVAAIGR